MKDIEPVRQTGERRRSRLPRCAAADADVRRDAQVRCVVESPSRLQAHPAI
ncbi:hypothetical protein [Burkholderia stabilis]|uniref:hypothetical protein n=1 Tax=Burkholderia stabilis TaxID=95485 RepID=UPI0013E9958E|nr:hypothetical protein [Burkholderia stabilis]